MGRGFISGTIWGAIVGVFILLVATQVAVRHDPLLPQPTPEAVLAADPDASEFAEVSGGDEPVAPAPETAPAGLSEAPATPAPPADVPPAADSTPLAEPLTETTAPEAQTAPEIAPAPQVSRIETAETIRPADVAAPEQPASEAPLVTGLDAPAPPPPAPQTTSDEDRIAAIVPEAPPVGAAPEAPPAVEDPAAQEPPEADIAAITPPAEQPRTVTVPEAPQPPAEEAPRWAAPPPAPAPAPETEAQDSDAPERAVVSAMPGERAGTLPSISDDPAASAPPDMVEAEAISPDNALQAYSAPFDSTSDIAIVSVVLVVPPGGTVSVDALAALPFPASYAIDALDPDASETAAALRAAGRELLMIPSLPEGATPTDVEVALQANLAVVPEAVAFIDLPEASFQADRTATAQVIAAASATGHGLVTFPRGLNTAQQIARRDGVPAGLVFRDLDGEGEDPGTIYRTLDQAAFRARQEGAVILVGRARPETLAVLTEWALGTRAASVSLAPVSAAILAQD
jgi:polysaccharide deacetylase 2 family uncharacterized protein YibQ